MHVAAPVCSPDELVDPVGLPDFGSPDRWMGEVYAAPPNGSAAGDVAPAWRAAVAAALRVFGVLALGVFELVTAPQVFEIDVRSQPASPVVAAIVDAVAVPAGAEFVAAAVVS